MPQAGVTQKVETKGVGSSGADRRGRVRPYFGFCFALSWCVLFRRSWVPSRGKNMTNFLRVYGSSPGEEEDITEYLI